MIKKAKNNIVKTFKSVIAPEKGISLMADDVKDARVYIEKFWVNLERYHPNDEESLIGLPNPYLVPAHDPTSSFNFDEMYYWDSYFMVQGMLNDPSKKELVMGILDNLFSLLRRYKVIPNANRTYLMGRSQPPLLTSFIFDVYNAYGLDRRWLEQAMNFAKTEYEVVWMGEKKPFWHQVHGGLSRYFDINVLNDLAEAESGWDMTTRFNRKCLNFLPIDLNAYLYKYESDFALSAEILNQPKEQAVWLEKAAKRKSTITKLMWNKGKGLFYDYDYIKEKQGSVASLASYVPLWAGMTTPEQTKQLVKNLKHFEVTGGLVTTEESLTKNGFSRSVPVQWAYPNGWAPLHFFVVQGLKSAGETERAEGIAKKWLKTNLNWFNQHGVFLEKYNVVQPEKPPLEGVYPGQVGFGWTNAIFERFSQEFIDK